MEILGKEIGCKQKAFSPEEQKRRSTIRLATDYAELVCYDELIPGSVPYDTRMNIKIARLNDLIYAGLFDAAREKLSEIEPKDTLKTHHFYQYLNVQAAYFLAEAVILAEERQLEAAKPIFLKSLLYEHAYLYCVTNQFGKRFFDLFFQNSIVYADIQYYYPDTEDDLFIKTVVDIYKNASFYLGRSIINYLEQTNGQLTITTFFCDAVILLKAMKESGDVRVLQNEEYDVRKMIASQSRLIQTVSDDYFDSFRKFFTGPSLSQKTREYEAIFHAEREDRKHG